MKLIRYGVLQQIMCVNRLLSSSNVSEEIYLCSPSAIETAGSSWKFWFCHSEPGKRYVRLCGEISWQFYGKKEVSIETIFIFIFYCATVSRENCMKLAALFSDYFVIKNETGWWFHNFKGHKIMKPPELVGKKDETDGTRLAASFIRETVAQ